jgi:Holliday junction resolvase RusA-like endonuclease
LPWPVSTNAIWRAVKGRNIKSEAYRKWQEAAGWSLAAQRPAKIKGPVRPSRRAFDLDNRIKAIADLLVAHRVIEGDHSTVVRELTVELGTGLPGALIEIVPLGGDPALSSAKGELEAGVDRRAQVDVA